MDQVLAKVKFLRNKPYFKLISDKTLFEGVVVDLSVCVPYNPDHNLDDDAWFKIEQFRQKDFCIDFLKQSFDSKDLDDLTKDKFLEIDYVLSVQSDDVYFQKIMPSFFIKRKIITFGEIAKLEESQNRFVVNSRPDAIYFKTSDTLIFRNLATISSIFKGIDKLYKEATNVEVKQFLNQSFIELSNGYNVNSVSKPNRKRIGLAMDTLKRMSSHDKINLLSYIEDYSLQKLNFDSKKQMVEISTDDELKLLLYGIEQRFYTTPFGQEKRLANSVVTLS